MHTLEISVAGVISGGLYDTRLGQRRRFVIPLYCVVGPRDAPEKCQSIPAMSEGLPIGSYQSIMLL
jgi:hypothetical protein